MTPTITLARTAIPTAPAAPAAAASWCPTCREHTVIDVGRKCAWCDTITVAAPPPRKPRGKPRGKHAHVTDQQLAAIHHVYVTKQVSVRQIAAQVWQRLGYKTEESCASSLHSLLLARGYTLRPQAQVTVERNLKHGLATRAARADGGEGDYRRWLKTQTNRYQPTCAGVRQNAPGKGKPCTLHAQTGSDFCYSHDPARKHERDQVTARMRARQDRPKATVPWADVHAQLAAWLAQHQHPAAALHRASGVAHATCSRLLLGRVDLITDTLAERLLRAPATAPATARHRRAFSVVEL